MYLSLRMAHRLRHYGTGKLVLLRENSPREIAGSVHELIGNAVPKIEVNTGEEVANIILNITQEGKR